ncbi:hypothetical protein JCGZ_18752 [Jatropha curcas]|uniref:NAC transcription factor 059 n=1 Tax=Jatropha curcas TaxID=180498 RepID=R4NHS0_JATCU|nr:NAC transcription factor 059 [Jatropha curcas]KDP29985.1 hypothetical protein JCGZ_18752 [Jatropha curcas]
MEENNNQKTNESVFDLDDYDTFFNSLPVGYRFVPRDDELITHYLMNKIANNPMPRNRIRVVNFYKQSPQLLTEIYKLDKRRETEWYFFTPRNKKYPKGGRPNRRAGNGYWKPTGIDKFIPDKENPSGVRKSLDYYEGKQGSGKRTDWKMHEYVIIHGKHSPAISNQKEKDHMQLDEWVLCKLYNNKADSKKNEINEEEETSNSNATVPIASASNPELANDSMIIKQSMCYPQQDLSVSPRFPPSYPSSAIPPLPSALDYSRSDYGHHTSYPYSLLLPQPPALNYSCSDYGDHTSCPHSPLAPFPPVLDYSGNDYLNGYGISFQSHEPQPCNDYLNGYGISFQSHEPHPNYHNDFYESYSLHMANGDQPGSSNPNPNMHFVKEEYNDP